MRKTGCPLNKSINLQKDFLKKIEYKVLQELKYLGFKTPSLK